MDSGPSESLNPSLFPLQTTKQLFAFDHYAKAWDGPLEPLLRESNFLYCLNFGSCVWEWCNICFKTPRRWNQVGIHRFSIFWPMIYTVWQHRLTDFQCFALSSFHCGWKELRAVGQGKGSDVLQRKAEFLVAILCLKSLDCWMYSYAYFYRVKHIVISVLW